MTSGATPARPGLSWSWAKAGLGLAYAVPAAVMINRDPDDGMLLAVGVLCAAAVGMPPKRSKRALIIFVGALAGLSLFLGSVLGLAGNVVVLVTLFALAVGASVTSQSSRVGPFVLVLGLPLVSAGLNETSASAGAGAGLLIFAGSVYAFVLALLWPEPRPLPGPRPPGPRAPRSFLLDYGVRLGLAGVLALVPGLALGIDHPAWASTSALMVGRPNPALTAERVAGRAIAVIIGSLAALALYAASVPPFVLAAVVALALAACTAVTGSRWYVTGGFTSFIVLTMLMVGHPDESNWWATERIAGNVYGALVGWALLGLLPGWRDARRSRRAATSTEHG